MDTFSERNGFSKGLPSISIRNDAPDFLRDYVKDLLGVFFRDDPLVFHEYIADKLLVVPVRTRDGVPLTKEDISKISNTDFYWWSKLEWYDVYDAIERAYLLLHSQDVELQNSYECCPDEDCQLCNRCKSSSFQDKINKFFFGKGIGWQLVDGKIIVRGDAPFEVTTKTALDLASERGKTATSGEMKEAILDLSRRPAPDLTGAVTHSMAALECLARDITGEPQLTLGDWMKKHKQEFPAPLDIVVDKLWGYSSEKCRHVKEGQLPSFEEAELVVTLSSAFSTYLFRKHPF